MKRSYSIWNNSKVELFHGTTPRLADSILRNGIDPSRGRRNTDFGRGFYTTTNLGQAAQWAQIKARRNQPAVLRVSVDRAALALLRSLVFTRPADDFWSFVERCRDSGDTPYLTQRYYDVVYGPVAQQWRGSTPYSTFPDYDQISFHGNAAKMLLRDRIYCHVEKVEIE